MSVKQRVQLLDGLRATAVLAMIIYHFAWDLGFFNIVDPVLVNSGPWKLFAISIGCSFLFLSGCSFWLASSEGINFRKFLWRLFILIVAALLVSLGTYQADPNTFVFFGILHLLAACTLFGLLIFKLPILILIFMSFAIISFKNYFVSDFFEPKYLAWTGLFSGATGSVDFYGFLPWSAAYVLGLSTAKILHKSGFELSWSTNFLFLKSSKRHFVQSFFFWIGRNSLLVYLIHQPILILCIIAYLRYV